MQNFVYWAPTEVIFGKDTELQVASAIKKFGGKRIFVVYGGGSVVRSGLLSRVEETLKKENLEYKTLGGVQPNPRLEFARKAVEEAKAFDADFILAVGAGSVIDTAKAVAHGVANPEVDLWDFWLRKQVVEKSLPVGSILTLSAAGSETSNSAVLTNEETGEKRGLSTDYNRPKFAIMNPELTYTLPKNQIIYGIVDIMMHTLDRYFTPTKGNAFTDEMAEALLRNVIKYGEKALENSSDYEAMSELMWCGSLSHNGMTGLGAVTDFAPHQLGHELSGKFDVAHGASLSAIWGAWASYSYKENPERFAQFGKKVWGIEEENVEVCAVAAIEKTVNYFKAIGAPTSFSELGIGIQEEESLRDLATRCAFYGSRTIGSFKVLNEGDIYNIYWSANK